MKPSGIFHSSILRIISFLTIAASVIFSVLAWFSHSPYGDVEKQILSSAGNQQTVQLNILPSQSYLIQTFVAPRQTLTALVLYGNPDRESDMGLIYYSLIAADGSVLDQQEIAVSSSNSDGEYIIHLPASINEAYSPGDQLSFSIATSSDAAAHPLLANQYDQYTDGALTVNGQNTNTDLRFSVIGITERRTYRHVLILCIFAASAIIELILYLLDSLPKPHLAH